MILYISGVILLFFGWIFFFLSLFPPPSKTVSVFEEKIKEEVSAVAPLLKPFRPFSKILVKFFGREKELKSKLYLVRWKILPEDFITIKQFSALFFWLIFFLLGIKKPFILIIVTFLGFIYPDRLLNSRVKKRKYSIVRILPETIELLGLCVGAGLDFMAAVRWVVEKVKINPMIEELMIVLKEINVGKPRVEALRDMAKRLDIPDVTSFVRTLVQADRMGTPVEEAFRILSEDIRMRRFHRGERLAMTAPIKMLIPLIFCILPVIMIIVAGPILIRFMQEGIFGGFSGKLGQ
ncbi:MAG: type II secretion system F family protein [Candidatus Omnitrophica bacterium]|nr:type II secretion system F family protein [Candidatus Omnitrophota bacterium]